MVMVIVTVVITISIAFLWECMGEDWCVVRFFVLQGVLGMEVWFKTMPPQS